ncbi:hypothetical protein EUTSA_v10015254mg [Eutrema salsugineum]|uniref:DUF1985 domain-containing protein n=1 Tax=Eutrema salsugineum TaxID=72664 RepID=V4LMF8_EUTSA|nr:hypothetical protein EUTSA_v10015254mg [Eutrema salsugineum]
MRQISTDEQSPCNDDDSSPDNRLPTRLFATDRYPICRVNGYSKQDTLTVLRNLLRDTPELDRILDSSFGGLFRLPANRAPISCKLIQALIARQLVTKHNITGLNCGLFEEGYETPLTEASVKEPDIYWKRWIGDDVKTTCADIANWLRDDKDMPSDRRIRLALLLIVDCVLIANHQTHSPTPRYVKMVDNLENFLNFPCGRESFIKTLWSMRPPNVIKSSKNKEEGPVQLFCKQLQQRSIKLNGFPLVLQLLAFRAIPLLLSKLPDPSDALRIIDLTTEGFPNNVAVTLNDVLDSEIDCNLVVNPMIDPPPSVEDGSGEWDDEVRDRKVEYMLKLIEQNHVFVKQNWPGSSVFVKKFLATMPDAPADQLRWLANQVALIAFKLNIAQPESHGTSKRTRSATRSITSKGRAAKRRRMCATKPPVSPMASSEEASIRLNEDHDLDFPNSHEHEAGPNTPVHHNLLLNQIGANEQNLRGPDRQVQHHSFEEREESPPLDTTHDANPLEVTNIFIHRNSE